MSASRCRGRSSLLPRTGSLFLDRSRARCPFELQHRRAVVVVVANRNNNKPSLSSLHTCKFVVQTAEKHLQRRLPSVRVFLVIIVLFKTKYYKISGINAICLHSAVVRNATRAATNGPDARARTNANVSAIFHSGPPRPPPARQQPTTDSSAVIIITILSHSLSRPIVTPTDEYHRLRSSSNSHGCRRLRSTTHLEINRRRYSTAIILSNYYYIIFYVIHVGLLFRFIKKNQLVIFVFIQLNFASIRFFVFLLCAAPPFIVRPRCTSCSPDYLGSPTTAPQRHSRTARSHYAHTTTDRSVSAACDVFLSKVFTH